METIDIFIGKIKNNSILFTYYTFFAGIATIVDFSVLYYLTNVIGIYYLISGAFAYLGGMLTNFSLNKHYTFNNQSKKVGSQFRLFVSVALVGLLLNQLILYVLVDMQNFWYMYAKVVSVTIVMFWSFIGHKKVTFRIES